MSVFSVSCLQRPACGEKLELAGRRAARRAPVPCRVMAQEIPSVQNGLRRPDPRGMARAWPGSPRHTYVHLHVHSPPMPSSRARHKLRSVVTSVCASHLYNGLWHVQPSTECKSTPRAPRYWISAPQMLVNAPYGSSSLKLCSPAAPPTGRAHGQCPLCRKPRSPARKSDHSGARCHPAGPTRGIRQSTQQRRRAARLRRGRR